MDTSYCSASRIAPCIQIYRSSFKGIPLFLLITVTMLAALATVPQGAHAANSDFAGGSGTCEDPWRVATIEQLQQIAQHPHGCFELSANIDASATSSWNGGEGFLSIGSSENGGQAVPFMGSLDGNGFRIEQLVIDRPEQNGVGLFASIGVDGRISNLHLTGARVRGGSTTGILAGQSIGQIHNVAIEGEVEGQTNVGLLVGNNAGLITGAVVEGEVSGTMQIGGLAGINSGEINGAEVQVDVEGTGNAFNVGGLVGVNFSRIVNAFVEGAVTSTGDNTGGLAGQNSGITTVLVGGIALSASSATVSGGDRTGGLIGHNAAFAWLEFTSASGNVTGEVAVGGLVGANEPFGNIIASNASGSVTGEGSAGGLAGFSDGYIENSFATGAVTGGALHGAGGLIGTFGVEPPGGLGGAQTPLAQDGGAETDRSTSGLSATDRASSEQPVSNRPASGRIAPPPEPPAHLLQVGHPSESSVSASSEDLVGSSAASSSALPSASFPEPQAEFTGWTSHSLQNESQSLAGREVYYSFSTGSVSGGNHTGGLIGVNYQDREITQSYWDVESSGQSDAAGAGNGEGATGLTTAQMTGDAAAANMPGLAFYPDGPWIIQAGDYPGLREGRLLPSEASRIRVTGPTTIRAGDTSPSPFFVAVQNAAGSNTNVAQMTYLRLSSDGDATFYDMQMNPITYLRIPWFQSTAMFQYTNNEVSESTTIAVEYYSGDENLQGVSGTLELEIVAGATTASLEGPSVLRVGEVGTSFFIFGTQVASGQNFAPGATTRFKLSSSGEGRFYSSFSADPADEITSITIEPPNAVAFFVYRNLIPGEHTIIVTWEDGDELLQDVRIEHPVIVEDPDREFWRLSPEMGGNESSIVVTLVGDGLTDQTELRLIRDGLADIPGLLLNAHENGRQADIRFNLAGQPTGPRDLEVTMPGSGSFVISDAFTVVESSDVMPELWSSINGMDQMVAGETTQFQIHYGNSGDMDLHDIMLFISLPAGVDYSFNEADYTLPSLDGIVNSEDFDGHDEYLDMEPWFEHDGQVVFPIWIYRMRAGESSSIRLDLTLPDTAEDGLTLSEQFGHPISVELGALPPYASEFTRTGDFTTSDPELLLRYFELIMVAALQEEGLLDKKALFKNQALSPDRILGGCTPDIPEPPVHDYIDIGRRQVAQEMAETTNELTSAGSYALGIGVGVIATAACASQPIGWGVCLTVGLASGGLTLFSFKQIFDAYDDLDSEECPPPPRDPRDNDPPICRGGCNPNGGSGTGDPHMITFDGMYYGFHAVGEFIMARSLINDLQVQARMEQMRPDLDHFSIITAAAVQAGGDIVVVEEARNVGSVLTVLPNLTVNGVATDLPATRGDDITLPGGAIITRYAETISIRWPEGGARVDIWQSNSRPVVGNRALGVEVILDTEHAGNMEGLLGENSGSTAEVFVTRDGTRLVPPMSHDELYDIYGNSWRITQEESLFGTPTFADFSMPRQHLTVDDFDAQVRQSAEELCASRGISNPILLNNCVFDVVLSGEQGFANDVTRLITPRPDRQVTDFLAADESRIQLTLRTLEAEGQPFQFNVTGQSEPVTLADDGDPDSMSDVHVIHPLPPGSYQVAISPLPDGWELYGFTCTTTRISQKQRLDELSFDLELSTGASATCVATIAPEGLLEDFVLQEPADNQQVPVHGDAGDELLITWEPSATSGEQEVTYVWQLFDDTGEQLLSEKKSDNDGREAFLTLTMGQLDSFLDDQGVPLNEEFSGIWTVTASYEFLERGAVAAHGITLQRDVVVGDAEIADLPESYRLDANYPNPFNPSTIIRFSIPEDADVTLSVYTILGQRVQTLVRERKEAGTYEVVFDASMLSSGVYLYRLQTPGFTSSRVMTLIK